MGSGSARTGSAAQDRVQDVEHLADAGLAIGEAQLQHGAVVLAQHLGVAVGLGGAIAGARVLRTFLFELTPGDPVTYAVIVVVLGATAVLASWVPGRRASRVDPATALRAE